MQFHVPQFIEFENKIFGQLTFKQFVYLLGGGGMIFITYTVLPFFLTILFGIIIAPLSIGLAFLKIQGKPLINVVQSGGKHFLSNRLYLWKKPSYRKKEQVQKKEQAVYLPKLTENKLQELSWNLDVKEKVK